jgi:glucose dehydrogenase
VVKDKVYVGVSGGEFGVRGWLAAYDVKDGKQVWRGYSMGPDSDTLIVPGKTTNLGKPVAAGSSIATREGDQWKIGGGATRGWKSYDPQTNLIFCGSGNPSTWNPKQRPGDNKYSIRYTHEARDVATQIELGVHVHGGFGGAETPGGTLDGRGIQRMDAVGQVHAQAFAGIEASGLKDKPLGDSA